MSDNVTSGPSGSGAGETSRYRVTHRTEYRYGAPVTSGQTIAHLLVRETPNQHVERADVHVEPSPDHRHTHIDGFGNLVSYLALQHPHEHLTVTAASDVSVTVPERPMGSPAWEDVPALLAGDTSPDGLLARQCTLDSPLITLSEDLASYARPSFPEHRAFHDAVTDLAHRIFTEFVFDPGFTDVTTPLAEVLDHRRGVCQDFAHLGIGCVRALGLPARYVSGYIETEPPPGAVKLIGSDASHAWFSVFIPGYGWLDADPTNDQVPPHRHVTVAWGRDYSDVSPVRGVVFGPAVDQDLAVAVDVVRLAPAGT
jgi:transglutaminase-like putative cysteine protease